jgi:hypothetical protein
VQTRLFNSDFYIAISFSSFFQDSWSPRKQTFDTTNLALEAIDVSSNCTEKKKRKKYKNPPETILCTLLVLIHEVIDEHKLFNNEHLSFIFLWWLELRDSHLLGRCSTTWATLSILFCVGYF